MYLVTVDFLPGKGRTVQFQATPILALYADMLMSSLVCTARYTVGSYCYLM